jgi:two-component system chemotaxis response regulator CheB
MFSSLTGRGAKVTLEALVAGANDYVAKPTATDTESIVKKVESELVPKIKAVYRPPRIAQSCAKETTPPKSTIKTHPTKKSHKISVIVIAVSTGGPSALAEILPHLTVAHAPPIVIVQHMPKEFTGHLATRLSKMCDQRVSEAKNGDSLLSEHIYMAPGGVHLEIQKHGREFKLAFHDGPPENSCRPSADVLFRSASQLFGSDVLALVLTGMGSDGLQGSKAICSTGGTIIAQDEPSSVVWGMPGQVVRAGIADAITPLDCIGPDVARRIYRQKT